MLTFVSEHLILFIRHQPMESPMFVRSILSSYYRLLTGAMLALAVIALTGCNEIAAEEAAPRRPVLVATVHYEAETPERSFFATLKPSTSTAIGFSFPGSVPH